MFMSNSVSEAALARDGGCLGGRQRSWHLRVKVVA